MIIIRSIILIILLILPSLSVAEYLKAIKSCEAFNRLHQRISKTRRVKNSGNIRLKEGYKYRIIEYRRDANEVRILIDYISQGNVRHRWVNRDCFAK